MASPLMTPVFPMLPSKMLSVGPNCYLAKTDVKNVFRLIPIHPDEYNILGIY